MCRRGATFVAFVLVSSVLGAWPVARDRQQAASTQVSPSSGAILTASATFAPGDHRLPSRDLYHPAITIRASNVTIDFSGAVLRGADADADPDTFTGVAVLVDGGDHVTIRNLTARGYKVGVFVRHSPNVH